MGCGRPPNSFCGGDASTICSTPAIWAGTTFITTELGNDGSATGHVQAHPPHRHPAPGDGAAEHHLDPLLRTCLRRVDGAHARSGFLEGGPDLGIELRKGSLQLRTGDPQVLRSHSVEALGGILHRVRAAGGDVLDDGPHGGDRGLDIQLGAGQGWVAPRRSGGANADRSRRGTFGHGGAVEERWRGTMSMCPPRARTSSPSAPGQALGRPVLVAFLLTLVAGGATSIGAALGVMGRGTSASCGRRSGLSAGVTLYVSFVELLPEGALMLSGGAAVTSPRHRAGSAVILRGHCRDRRDRTGCTQRCQPP